MDLAERAYYSAQDLVFRAGVEPLCEENYPDPSHYYEGVDEVPDIEEIRRRIEDRLRKSEDTIVLGIAFILGVRLDY